MDRHGWARRLSAAVRRLGSALDPPGTEYRLTRWLFLRLLGLVYAIAFLVSARQAGPLIGDGGLLPARLYLDRAAASAAAPWLEVPSLLWISTSDGFLAGLAWLGFAGSLLLLAGYASGPHLLLLWVLYSSFVNAGQLFYGTAGRSSPSRPASWPSPVPLRPRRLAPRRPPGPRRPVAAALAALPRGLRAPA